MDFRMKYYRYLNRIKVFLTFNFIFFSLTAQYQKIDSLKDMIQNVQLNDSLLTSLYQRISQEYKNVDVDSTYSYLNKAKQTSKYLENVYLYCHTNVLLGDYFNRNGLPDSMKYYYNQSLSLANMNGLEDIQASIYNGYGVYHMNLSNYDTALFFMQQASKISESINDMDMLNKSYNNIGIIHYHLGNYDKSLYYYNKSLDIRKNLEYIDSPRQNWFF